MNIGSLLLVIALLGQVGLKPAGENDTPQQQVDPDQSIEEADEASVGEGRPARGGNPKQAAEPDHAAGQPADDLTPLRTIQARPGTADALLEWLANGDASLEGKRVALADLLSRVYDRAQQAMLVAAYWKLSAATAEYRIAADESLRLSQLLPPADAAGKHASDPLLETRLASAEARVREAELSVIAQQFALAEQMRLPANEPLPLAGDLPHAGAYRTYFQERYSRVAPPRSHLIDRTLPLLQRSVELRAAAAIAAADSAEAEAEAYHAGQLDLLAAIDCVTELTRQRRAFVAAVRDYNLDIAEYALSVAPAALSGPQLVGMLIGPPRAAPAGNDGSRKQVASGPNGVKPARFDAPLNDTQPTTTTPTLAPPRGTQNVPRSNAPSGTGSGEGRRHLRDPSSNQSGQAKPTIKSRSPADTSRRDERRRHVTARPPDDLAADESAPLETDLANANSSAADQGLYRALADLSPVKRAQELSATLHWDRDIAPDDGTPTSLVDALASTAGPEKRTLIEAYWRGREQVAAAEVVRQEAELLKAFEAVALAAHEQPGGAEAMLRLRTAQLSVEAAQQEATIGVLTAQFNLGQLMRRPPSNPWPWPTTPPHAGGYRLKLDEQPGTIQQVSLVRHASKTIPARYEALQRRADAVIAADAARLELIGGFEAGQRRVSDAVASVRQLTSESLAFLDAQTQYNLQFADYVMAVAPPGTPDATLAGVLVVKR